MQKAFTARTKAIKDLPKELQKPSFFLYEGLSGKAYAEAAKGLKRLKEDDDKTALEEFIASLEKKFDAKAQIAESLVESKDICGAILALKDLAAKFKGCDLGKKADSRAKDIAKDKDLKDARKASEMYYKINSTTRTTNKKQRDAAIAGFESLIKKYEEKAPEIAELARQRIEVLR